MSEEQNRTFNEKFMLRLPDGMRDRIKLAADANGRSMNAEIVNALEERFPAPTEFEQFDQAVEVFTNVLDMFIKSSSDDPETVDKLRYSKELLVDLREEYRTTESKRERMYLAANLSEVFGTIISRLEDGSARTTTDQLENSPSADDPK